MLRPAGLFLLATIVCGSRPSDSGSPVSFWTYPVWYDNRETDSGRGASERNLGSRGATPPSTKTPQNWPPPDTRYSHPARPLGPQNWPQSRYKAQNIPPPETRHPQPSRPSGPQNWLESGNNPQIWPQRPHETPNRPQNGRNQPQLGQIHPQSDHNRPPPIQNWPHPRPPRSAEDNRDVDHYKSDLESPKDVPTRPDYKAKGLWVKGRLPNDKIVDVGFVPQKVYTQVRRYDTVRHLPRSAAVAEASTCEQLINAPRLREVLSHKKIQQVLIVYHAT